MPASRHAPVRWSTYVQVHENRLSALVRMDAFMKAHTLRYEFQPKHIRIAGEIACLGNIVIAVDKTLAILTVDPDPRVETILYAYNASVRGYGNIVRYDNAHVHGDHPDRHHLHEYDWRTGALVAVNWVGEAGWPTLGDFIDEMHTWYCENREHLPEPEAVPDLDPRYG